MRLRRIELEHVRKFRHRVVVDGLSDGLNLIVGANEAGKSTLLAGLEAGLFLKHGSRRARDLKHNRDETAPRVALELEIDGERLRYEKRFLQRPRVDLQVGGTSLTGDAAEEAFAARLSGGGPDAAGIWNLLLVGQGQSISHEVDAQARGAIQASLEAQLESVMGGGRVKEIIGRLDDRLTGQKGLIDRRTGRPKGRFRDLDQEIAGLDERLSELEERRRSLAFDLARLDDLQREHSRDGDPARAIEAEIHRLAPREALLIQRMGATTLAARAEREQREAESAWDARRELIGRWETALTTCRGLEAAAGDAALARDATRVEGEKLAAELAREDALIQSAAAWLAAQEEAERLRAAAAQAATEVAFDLTEDARGRLRLDGSGPASRRFRVRVHDRLTIDIAGIGRIGVHPLQAETLVTALRAVEGRAATARAEIGRLTDDPIPDVADLDAFRAQLDRLREDRAGLAGRLEDARTTFRDARSQAVRAVQEHDRALAELAGLERELAEARAGRRDDALERAAAAAASEGAAAVPPDVALDDGPDLAAVRARLGELHQERESARRRRFAREMEIATLSERIATMQGRGLREEVDELRRRRNHLVHERDSLGREVEVTELLRTTLSEAWQEVRESSTRPLLENLRPAMEELLPGAELGLDDDLQIGTVTRDGTGEEPFAQLSHGTREQLAVVARLAFAQLLIDTGRPCFVVLDDALVFSDDDRLERMFRILERAGRKVQILVLTCRERAFAGLCANRVRIEPVNERVLAAQS